MTKKFLLQIEDNEETAWMIDDRELERCIRNQAQQVVNTITHGPRPNVTILPEEQLR
jgi:hypothetical protein